MAKRGVSKAQWLEEAMTVLADEGIRAVKIGRLAERLGIARSGFYWHFEDREDLLDELLQYWAHEYTEVVPGALETWSDPPAERLLRVLRMVDEYDLARLDLAMRAWAEHDDQARELFDRVYARRLEIIGGIFAELGFTGEELAMRTRLFVCFTSWNKTLFGAPPADTVDEAYRWQIAILTAPVPSADGV